MKRARWFGCAAVLLAGAPVPGQGVELARRAFVELDAGRDAVFAGQRFRLTLRFGIEERFLRENLVQPFRRALGVPVRVELSWLEDHEGAVVLSRGTASGPGAGPTCVVQGGMEHARRVDDREIDGARFVVHEVERRVVVERAGELRIPAPRLHVVFATEFREDFLDGRVPVDRQDATVAGADLVLRVEPLPVVGRPPEFTGAVGRFSARAETDRSEVAVGGSFKLVLTIEGDGSMSSFEMPWLEQLDGFHVLGRIEDREGERRVVTYDLAPTRGDVRAVPAITFAYFDPEPPVGYRTVRTDAIPLVVGPAGPGVEIGPVPVAVDRTPVPGENDILGPKIVAGSPDVLPSGGGERGWAVGALVAPWVFAVAFVTWRVARNRRERRAAAAHLHRAHQTFLVAVQRGDVTGAFVDYLATRLQQPPAAIVSPDLAARLARAGIPAAPAERAAQILEVLVASRHGRALDPASVARAGAVVEELEAAFCEETPAR